MADQTERITTRPHGAPRGFAIAWAREAGSLDPARAVASMAGCAGTRAATGMVERSSAGGRFYARQFFGSRPAHPSRGAGDAGVIVLADCRLTRTVELARALGLPSESGDVDLIAAAYRKWGEELGSRLDGDYAIVIWDESLSRLVLLRDPFAMRPLHWAIHRGVVLVASEIRMLHVADVPARVDEQRLILQLCGPIGRVGHSFWSGVVAGEPGETLVLGDRTDRKFTHWRPRVGRPWTTSRLVEAVEGLDEVLTASTADRTDPGATALSLSGGVDSTCVALSSRHGALAAFSYAFEWFPQCDERSRSDPVARHVGIEINPVQADEHWPFSRVRDGVAALYDAPIEGSYGELAQALFDRVRDRGCHTVLGAHRGDELIGSGVWDLPGLLFAGRFGQFARDWSSLSGGKTLRGALRRLYGRFVVAPIFWRQGPRVARLFRRPLFRRKPLVHLPDHVSTGRNGEMLEKAILAPYEMPLPEGCTSGALAHRWRQVMLPACARLSEVYERRAVRAGIEYSDPWADRRVAEYVLRLPPWLVEGPGRKKDLARAYIAARGPTYPGPHLGFLPNDFWKATVCRTAAAIIDDLAQARELRSRDLCNVDALRREIGRHRDGVGMRFDFSMVLDAEYWLRCI